jgi:hypothetical protein
MHTGQLEGNRQPHQGDEADGLRLPGQRLLLPEDQSRISRQSVTNQKDWWPRPAKNDSAHW